MRRRAAASGAVITPRGGLIRARHVDGRRLHGPRRRRRSRRELPRSRRASAADRQLSRLPKCISGARRHLSRAARLRRALAHWAAPAACGARERLRDAPRVLRARPRRAPAAAASRGGTRRGRAPPYVRVARDGATTLPRGHGRGAGRADAEGGRGSAGRGGLVARRSGRGRARGGVRLRSTRVRPLHPRRGLH